MNRFENEPFAMALNCLLSQRERGSAGECAKFAGLSSGYFSELKRGIKEGKEDKRRLVAHFFGWAYEDFLSLGRHLANGGTYLTWKTLNPPAGTKPVDTTVSVGWTAEKPAHIEPPLDHNVDLDDALPVSTKLVPLISWVTAGAFCGVVDNFQPGDAEEWIGCDVHVGENAFALEIVGDSMETEFRNGDRIIIDPSRQWENGSFVVVKIGEGEGQEATFKRIIKDGDKVYLKAENPIYPMRDMTGVPFTVCGVVVEKRKCYV